MSRRSSGNRLIRFSTAFWIVSGSASDARLASADRFPAPLSSLPMPPESTSAHQLLREERVSSLPL
jgi:hypothetical protein